MQFTAADENVPVLIVGGGGAGLTASMLLTRQGVEHLLVSARATTSDLPKAHVLTQRAMEVPDDVGVAEAIAQRDTPTEQMEATAFYAGLTALRGMRAQSMEFTELNVEYGYSNESAAVVCDGIPVADLVDDIRVYQPSTRPGSPLPHAWIDDEDGSRRAIKDLVAPDRFLLIAGEDGEACCEAARALATEADLPLDAMRIGHVPAGAAA